MIAVHEAAGEGGADVHAYLSGLQEADDRIDIVRNIWIDQLSDTERLLDRSSTPARPKVVEGPSAQSQPPTHQPSPDAGQPRRRRVSSPKP